MNLEPIYTKIGVPNSVTRLNWTSIFEYDRYGFSVVSRTDIKTACVEKRLDCVLKIWKPLWGSIVNISGGGIWPFDEHENFSL